MNNDYKRWRQEFEVEEEVNPSAVGKVAELEQEYKRVVWMSSAKKGRAYWKGYLSALQFAIDVLSKE
nr:hypothetical protein [uncultured Trichococcus sp.]